MTWPTPGIGPGEQSSLPSLASGGDMGLLQWIGRKLGILPASREPGRSPKWPAKQRAWLKDHSTCAACGTKKNLNVHHIWPVAWPGGLVLELEDSNLITLCRECHFDKGHYRDWRARNPDVAVEAAAHLLKIRTRPYPSWARVTGHQRPAP
jgi:hypothetical protein